MDRRFRRRSISFAVLLGITRCCYEFHGMPTQSGRILAARRGPKLCIGKTKASCHAHLGAGTAPCTRCRRPRRREIWRQKLLWRHFSRSILCALSLFSAERLIMKERINFFPSQIKLKRPFFPHLRNKFDRRTGWYEKTSSKMVLLAAVVRNPQGFGQLSCSHSGRRNLLTLHTITLFFFVFFFFFLTVCY